MENGVPEKPDNGKFSCFILLRRLCRQTISGWRYDGMLRKEETVATQTPSAQRARIPFFFVNTPCPHTLSHTHTPLYQACLSYPTNSSHCTSPPPSNSQFSGRPFRLRSAQYFYFSNKPPLCERVKVATPPVVLVAC